MEVEKKNLASFALEGQRRGMFYTVLQFPKGTETQLQSTVTCWITASFVDSLHFPVSLGHIPTGTYWISFSQILILVSASNRPQSKTAAKRQKSDTNPGLTVNKAHTLCSPPVKIQYPCAGDAPTGTELEWKEMLPL